MSATDAREYLYSLTSDKYIRIMDVLSYKGVFVDINGNPHYEFMDRVQEHTDNLERVFSGKPVDDDEAISLAWFVKGLLSED